MKIIAKRDDGFIIDISHNELSNFCGYYSLYSDRKPDFKIGNEINVSEIYNKYSQLVNNIQNLKTIKNECERILNSVSVIDPISKIMAEIDKEVQ